MAAEGQVIGRPGADPLSGIAADRARRPLILAARPHPAHALPSVRGEVAAGYQGTAARPSKVAQCRYWDEMQVMPVDQQTSVMVATRVKVTEQVRGRSRRAGPALTSAARQRILCEEPRNATMPCTQLIDAHPPASGQSGSGSASATALFYVVDAEQFTLLVRHYASAAAGPASLTGACGARASARELPSPRLGPADGAHPPPWPVDSYQLRDAPFVMSDGR